MITSHCIKYLLVLTLLFAGILHVSGDTACNIVYVNKSPPPSGITKLEVNYPDLTGLVHVVYYQSTSGNVEVNVSWCSTDAALSSEFKSVFANTTNEPDNVMVFVGMNTVKIASSPASRLTGSFALLLSALFASLFFLPKSRLSGILVLCVICIAVSSADDATNVVTVRIGLPSQITTVCENNNCHAPSFTSTSAPTPAPTPAPTNITGLDPTYPPTIPPTDSPTSGSVTSGSVSTSGSTTTDSPTAAPTSAPTLAPTLAPTSAPTLPPASLHFNLRVLILSGAVPISYPVFLGADFAQLAFASVGTPYDYVKVDASTDLSTYLSTTGTGKYSGIVSVNWQGVNSLSTAQTTLITSYQKAYGVKWVVVGTKSLTGLSGVTAGNVISDQYFDVTFAPQFAQYGKFLNQSISVNTKPTINWSPWQNTLCELLPVTITDSTSVTPVINAHATDGTTSVAAAVFNMTDGTQQLHYFLDQGADFIHSMAFASVMVNWISPGGLFMGQRRLTFLIQPDDLFLGSYTWNLTTHTNPIGPTDTWYRISADDLQLLADNIDKINAAAPSGSYVTVEWPTNFGGVNNLYYTRNQHDYLYDKAQELIDKFYYLSHTWDHPCTFDDLNETAGYSTMNSEVSQNIAFAPGFFQNKMHLWSNTSMITPCVTGLYNGGALQAMSDNGITACVSDESVTEVGHVDYEPITPYHGVYSTSDPNNFVGIYFVPRETLDIDYSAMTPADVVDEYNTNRTGTPLDFEQIMTLQRMYALEDKIAFRHDPFMLHQTNAATFTYTDPTPDPRFGFGATYNTSLVALFMQRVVGDIMLYYNLPIVAVQMDNLVKMFQQRQQMDECGLTTTFGVTNGQIVDLSITSQAACHMALSGGVVLTGETVQIETIGSETTAWIDFKSASTQSFSLSAAIPL